MFGGGVGGRAESIKMHPPRRFLKRGRMKYAVTGKMCGDTCGIKLSGKKREKYPCGNILHWFSRKETPGHQHQQWIQEDAIGLIAGTAYTLRDFSFFTTNPSIFMCVCINCPDDDNWLPVLESSAFYKLLFIWLETCELFYSLLSYLDSTLAYLSSDPDSQVAHALLKLRGKAFWTAGVNEATSCTSWSEKLSTGQGEGPIY